MIIDQLSKIQVSKSWNILALDGSNWQQVDLFEFQVDVEGIVVENLSKRCGGFLKSLSLKGCQVWHENCQNPVITLFLECWWLSLGQFFPELLQHREVEPFHLQQAVRQDVPLPRLQLYQAPYSGYILLLQSHWSFFKSYWSGMSFSKFINM